MFCRFGFDELSRPVAATELLRRSVPAGEGLAVDGEALTAEAVRAALRGACARHGAPAPREVIVASVWQGFGHEAGSGPLPANLPTPVRVLVQRCLEKYRKQRIADISTAQFLMNEQASLESMPRSAVSSCVCEFADLFVGEARRRGELPRSTRGGQ